MSAHHIPEGMAVGLAVAAAGEGNAMSAGALILAMAVHNTFEGMAVAVPMHAEGMTRRRSFAFGQASGLFEVAGGVVGAIAVTFSAGVLPYGLAVAAGAMLFVALGDVLPEARRLSATPRVAAFATAGAASVAAMQWFAG
jgi:ZIP family zinc transporter